MKAELDETKKKLLIVEMDNQTNQWDSVILE